MAQASIRVDIFNPGQVFACMGFLEAADVLLGHAEGGFDWTDEADASFCLAALGDDNPYGAVLGFLAGARLRRLAPGGYSDPASSKEGSEKKDASSDSDKKPKKQPAKAACEFVSGVWECRGCDGPLHTIETLPGARVEWMTLPARLDRDSCHVDVSHWCDASSRTPFKLFAGQQRGPAIAKAMLKEVAGLWKRNHAKLACDPFGLTVPLGGSSFKFDARKSWTAIDAGYSPDEQTHGVEASPVVEMLAAIGLEHARPDEFETREVRYGVWKGLLPPALARPALGASRVGVPTRMFRFTLDLAGKNKVVTFAQEETST